MGIALKSMVLLAILSAFSSNARADESEKTWAGLKPDVFGERVITDGADVIELAAPVRAEDAAITPIDIIAKAPQTPEKYIKTITLIVDENPAPVVAAFTFGPVAASASLSTRVRIDSYTYVRVIAEMNDGSLHMVKKYVKASGGCSAPASKDADKAIADMGKMKLRQFAVKAGDTTREAQIMIRHPNYSGLQMDQVMRTYTPAHFIRDLEVRRGGNLVFKMEGGISLSEDPNIRFNFTGASGDIKVTAKDTENQIFEQSWPIAAAGS
ncbi:MAG: quinoprotein dehydrogenase-associated SoxYZ-like carrier [Chitinophagales bacterium]|nr:quinoprotein dehydrogenase-associated SoxYZ-like carrier [Hyphomicrobiales bacterium]